MTTNIRTEVLTLSGVAKRNIGFSIPSYQRPYVWPTEDVLKLFEDIRDAFTSNEPHYFIGSVLSALESNGCDYELIDGQQRTTTLMLFSLTFKAMGIDCPLAKVAVKDAKPRLTFAIRNTVLHLLGSRAGLDTYTSPSPESIKQDPYLTNIDAALSVLQQSIAALASDNAFKLKEFADFVFTKVQWVNNIVPADLDLNRLFSNLNTTGIQLEPVDLLKAKLFKKITTDVALYSAIWQACEHTENYFERNLRQLFEKADWNQLEYKDLSSFSPAKFTPNAEAGADDPRPSTIGFSIAQLAAQLEKQGEPENVVEKTEAEADFDDETVYCRSIISFELLLIHTLRIFYARNGWQDTDPRIKASNLLLIFESFLEKDESTVKAFIELLWQVRYQFDTWVVKWVEHDDSNDPQLRLTYQSRSQSSGNYYINRTARELSALVQLQAVRNFTGDRSAHYWLTAFLAKLIRQETTDYNKALHYLEQIDNYMSLASGTQKEASFSLAKNKKPKYRLKWSEKQRYLESSLGTSFEHYWFQKLEYLLWKQLKQTESNLNSEQLKKFKRYRITSKNSVEHIHPQNNSKLDPEHLHHFGNLVLLSPGENSSYSDKPESVKRAEFMKKDRYDSLKSKFIFEQMGDGGDWTKDKIESHFAEVLSIFDEHYSDKE